MDLLNYAQESAKRDAALQKVLDNSGDWSALALIELEEIGKYSKVNEFTNTDIRFWLVPLIGNPHSCNCWGGFVMKAVRRGLIEDTGAFRRTGAHARRQVVYRWSKR